MVATGLCNLGKKIQEEHFSDLPWEWYVRCTDQQIEEFFFFDTPKLCQDHTGNFQINYL